MKNFKVLWMTFLVFTVSSFSIAQPMKINTNYRNAQGVISKETHLKEIESPDFILDHILKHYQTMIHDSNLCWAACMESLIKGYETDSEVGKEQYQIANYYHLNFLADISNSKGRNAQIHQIAMKDSHYEQMFTKAGFHISSLNPDDLENYKSVRNSLQSNSVLLVRSLENEVSHILMIIGYKDKRYFVMDPDSNSKKFYYWGHKNITMKYGVEKLWAVSATC